MSVPDDDVFLTTEEVLAYLKINLRTIYRLIKAGKIPAVRVGRHWRYRKRDIDAWLEGQRQAGEAVPAAPVRNRRDSRKRVLVVDDEASIRELLTKTLALATDEAGTPRYEVETATDASAALDRMRDSEYDLLIADLKMPGMDGLALIREAKRLQGNLPVIIITGYSSESSAIEAVNLGVDGYLIKPVRVPDILTAAAKAIAQ